jgi:hypothetical protein
LGRSVDVAVAASLPPALLRRLSSAGEASGGGDGSSTSASTSSSVSAAAVAAAGGSAAKPLGVAVARVLEKLSTVLKEQLHAFDQQRLALFRVMQQRLAAHEQVGGVLGVVGVGVHTAVVVAGGTAGVDGGGGAGAGAAVVHSRHRL